MRLLKGRVRLRVKDGFRSASLGVETGIEWPARCMVTGCARPLTPMDVGHFTICDYCVMDPETWAPDVRYAPEPDHA